MKSKPRIGIIGGAGPMAGALLFEKIIRVSQNNGCKVDADFPFCFLMSYPFSAMLTQTYEKDIIEKQVEECFKCLETNNVSIAAIACNTLHSFLPKIPNSIELVHMIEETKNFVKMQGWKQPLILCSSTSALTKLHARYFCCRYPNPSLQNTVDLLIDKITEGCCFKKASELLEDLCKDEGPIVLGCTELTLLHDREPLKIEELCSPDSIVAEKIGQMIFQHEKSTLIKDHS